MSDNNASLIWTDVINLVEQRYDDRKMSIWLTKLKPIHMDGAQFIAAAQFSWPATIVMRDYRESIEACLFEITLDHISFSVEVKPELFEVPNNNLEDQSNDRDEILINQIVANNKNNQETRIEVPSIAITTNNPVNKQPIIDSNKTFDTFIVGDSNIIAQASARKVAEAPGQIFNPFFLYSKSGLGKTHLLMAINNYVREYYPNLLTMYVTAEQYLQDYIKEIRDSKSRQSGQPIMTQYRNVDVLLIDDIQFLESKNESQEFFFVTFNELIEKGKQIVISADRSPKELNMDERMTSRFMSGLCQDIQPPTYELKHAIVSSFYKRRLQEETWYNAQITDEQISHIASICSSNIREIEGFMTKIMVKAATKNLTNEMITLQDIDEEAAELFSIIHKKIDISTIQKVTEKHYGISHEDIIGSSRKKNINLARQVAWFLARELTDESFSTIGEKFGNRNHATVMNGVNNVQRQVKQNRLFYDELEKLKESIRERS